jgi:hypothetical protein
VRGVDELASARRIASSARSWENMQTNALSHKAHASRCAAATRQMNKLICSSKQFVWELINAAIQRISDPPAAPSTPSGFALPWQGAAYNLLF